MNSLDELVSLPLLIDVVMAITLLEALALVACHRLTGKGVALRDFGVNMLSGLCLMLALRCVLHDSGAAWVAGCLLAAGLAHGADIMLRWKAQSSPVGTGPSPRPHPAGDGRMAPVAGVSR